MILELTMTDDVRQRISDAIEMHFTFLMDQVDKLPTPNTPGYCAVWAMAAAVACFGEGVQADVVGGTSNWQCNRDPAPSPTHVGHFWQDESVDDIQRKYLSKGILPEMHLWAYAREYNLIIDPSTRSIKPLAASCGVRWDDSEPEPPQTLFCKTDELPEGWFYVPHSNASSLAQEISLILASVSFLRGIKILEDAT